MRKLFYMLFLCIAASGHAKIYDCFMFFNELELLKMRLSELDPVVDHFVLVECVETQRGTPKALYFQENRHLFEPYLSKIIHVIVDERHPEMELWDREHYQRECIARGLEGCDAADTILISDLDEIPRPELVPSIASRIKKKGIVACQMSIYFYQLNRQTITGETWGGGPWIGTVIAPYKTVKRMGIQCLRDNKMRFAKILNAGWHFTWMGGKDKIRQKMKSVVEGNPEAAEYISDAELDRWIKNHPVVPIDDTFPEYVRKNKDYLRSIGFIAD
jgi:hypothetical protein